MDIASLLRMSEKDRFLKFAELLAETQLSVLDYVQGQSKTKQLVMESLANVLGLYSFMMGVKDLDEKTIIKLVQEFIKEPSVQIEDMPKFPKLMLVK